MVATRRRFEPNLQRVRILVNGAAKRAYVCTRCLKGGKVQKAAKAPAESVGRARRNMDGVPGARRAARGACPRTRPYSRYDRVLRPWPRTARHAPTTRNIPPGPP